MDNQQGIVPPPCRNSWCWCACNTKGQVKTAAHPSHHHMPFHQQPAHTTAEPGRALATSFKHLRTNQLFWEPATRANTHFVSVYQGRCRCYR